MNKLLILFLLLTLESLSLENCNIYESSLEWNNCEGLDYFKSGIGWNGEWKNGKPYGEGKVISEIKSYPARINKKGINFYKYVIRGKILATHEPWYFFGFIASSNHEIHYIKSSGKIYKPTKYLFNISYVRARDTLNCFKNSHAGTHKEFIGEEVFDVRIKSRGGFYSMKIDSNNGQKEFKRINTKSLMFTCEGLEQYPIDNIN